MYVTASYGFNFARVLSNSPDLSLHEGGESAKVWPHYRCEFLRADYWNISGLKVVQQELY